VLDRSQRGVDARPIAEVGSEDHDLHVRYTAMSGAQLSR
jgi:hypothetical protein